MNAPLLGNSIIALLILILIVAGVVALASRRVLVTRPDHLHWIVRILCIVLCVAALTATGVGTWQGTNEDLIASPVNVLVPTQAPPPLALTGDEGKSNIGPAKFVGTVLLASKQHDRFLPLCGESISFEWPPKSTTELDFHGEHGGVAYTITFDLRQLDGFRNGREMQTRLSYSRTTRGDHWSSSGGGLLPLEQPVTESLGHGISSLRHAPLSLIPTGDGQELRLFTHLARADRDDPLEKIPAAQWLASQAGKLPQEEAARINSYPGVRFDPEAPPGIRMLVFLGPSVVLLLLAAIAGAAVFRSGRRAYAFAGMLALMVLYAGVLDAMVLQRRANLANDAGQAESVRALALSGMLDGTFFHGGAAVARIRGIAADPATPEYLRQDARSKIER
ncbi:MAG: hypothetical protein NTW21_35300 [Verrucomicrobia bacterium]|nr:hypothetical protein [Verrucomicrobiota bacterium]